MKGVIMPGKRIGLLIILLSAIGLPALVRAKSATSMSHGTQMFSEFDNVCADKQGPWLRAEDLFIISVLPEISCFDSPEQSYINVEWISIAEILNDTSDKNSAAVEPNQGGFGEVSFAPSKFSIMALFVMASPCEFLVGHYEIPLAKAEMWQTVGL